MSQRRIFGICLVKDEDDIIRESLSFAARFCERIFVIDNGSVDRTWDVVQRLATDSSNIVPFDRTREPFDNAMRSRVYNSMYRDLSDDDWWLILDADEFLAEDPHRIVDGASKDGADNIQSWIIQFYFTERDAQEYERGNSDRTQPIFDRRRYYLINWREMRLFRNNPRRHWEPNRFMPSWLTRVCSRKTLTRHYQYRDPEQISKRLRLRYGHSQFSHVQSLDWHDVIRDSRRLNFHQDDAPWRFSPSGILYFYRRNLSQRLQSAYQEGFARRIARR